MTHSIHFLSKSIPGCASPDGGCLPCSGVSGKAVTIPPSSPKFISDFKFLSLRCVSISKYTSSVCNAGSSSSRRNPDFSRQNKFVRNRNKGNEEKEFGYEEFEDSATLSSKNGSVLSVSGNQKFQATSAPGPREKEIVELFRKVQAQLRERTAMKEERRVEESQEKSKESETVDSLLKLLRKHSVQQGKRNIGTANKRDNQHEQIDRANGEGGGVIISDDVEDEIQESPRPQISRPKSNFQRRSPVPEVKLQLVYSEGLDAKKSDLGSYGNQNDLEADDCIPEVEADVESLFSEGNTFGEMSDEESSEVYKKGHNLVEGSDLSGMKLTELKAIAKSRGMKGFSKLKKNELIELLSKAV